MKTAEEKSLSHKAGDRVADTSSGVQAIVVRSGPDSVLTLVGDDTATVLLGKRYACSECPAELLVTKGGPAVPVCHGQPMKVAAPKTLPSSD